MTRDRIPPVVILEVLHRDDGCIAPRLGGSAMDCWGRNRIEHVKKDPRSSKRAEPLTERLVTLCEGHTEPGMKAGFIWCTNAVNRNLCRDYLNVWARFRTIFLYRAEYPAENRWLAYFATRSPALGNMSPGALILEGQAATVLASLDAIGEGAHL